MSTRVTLAWLAVAVILGGLAIYLFQANESRAGGAQKYATGESLIQFNPADLLQIEFKSPDREREVFTRDLAGTGGASSAGGTGGGGGGWVLTLERPVSVKVPTASPGVSWPVLDSRIQAFLQKLQETKCVMTPQDDASLTGGSSAGAPTVIRLTFRTPQDAAGASTQLVQLNLAAATLAGTGMVEVIDERTTATSGSSSKPAVGRLALIDDWLHRVCATPGPRAWRDPTAMPMAKADVARVRLESAVPGGLRVVSLGRVDGRWGLREPVVAPADREAIAKLLTTLGSVNIADFLDNGPGSADTRLDRPAAKVQLEYDRRSITAAGTAANTQTISSQLEIGGAAALGAGASADRLYARLDQDRIITIDARPLAAMSMDPASFVWPFPTTQVPADIGTVLMEVRTPDGASIDASSAPGTADPPQRVYRRNLDKWVRANPDGSESPLVDDSRKQVDELLAFLSGSSTVPVRPAAITLSPPTRFIQFGRLSLLSLGAGELEKIDVGESGAGLVTLRTGPVYRTWPEDKLPTLIAELRARAKAAGIPIDGLGGASSTPSGESPTK